MKNENQTGEYFNAAEPNGDRSKSPTNLPGAVTPWPTL